jgi:hypothetical protein
MAVQTSTEQRYQQATAFYTRIGIVHTLQRQWEFLKEPSQQDVLMRSILLTTGTVIYCTKKGLQIGENVANSFDLKNERRDVVILCGGGVGFLTGVGLSVTGNALFIQNSKRIEEWKKMKIHNIVGDLIRREFENDEILSQFQCPISQEPISVPIRTPCGQAFEFDSLVAVAEKNNGIIKDIYNKTIPMPNVNDPQGTRAISYSLDACLPDAEMTIIIYKRFRYLINHKCQESGLSLQTNQFLTCYRNALGDFVKVLYLEEEGKINQKKLKVVMKDEATEAECEQAEATYNSEVSTFKGLFGNSALADIDWNIKSDWASVLNNRWMKEYHS